MKIVKKLTAAVAAVCLAATTSCSATIGNGTQNALDVDGVQINSGMPSLMHSLFIKHTMQTPKSLQ